MIFILEDDPVRIQAFKKLFAGKDLCITKNIGQAKILFQQYKFEHVLLDHDLGDVSYEKDIPITKLHSYTGADLTAWLRNHPDIAQCNPHYVIHSLNWYGAKRMKSDLEDIGLIVDVIPRLWKEETFNLPQVRRRFR